MESRALTTKQIKEYVADVGSVESYLAMTTFWAEVDHWFPWFTARRLLGINIKMHEGGFIAIVKGQKKEEKPQVAFVGGSDVTMVLWAVTYSATHDLLNWRVDRYAKD
jgi:hypothetical protein